MKKVLKEFNKCEVRYCLLRNFESLSGELDIVIHKHDLSNVDSILVKHAFKKLPQQFSLKHIGYARGDDTFDIQVDGVYWNDMPYLSSEQVFHNKIKKGIVYTLGDEESFIMYVCHSILGKRRFRRKYKFELIRLSKKVDIYYVIIVLSKVFGEQVALEIIANIRMNKFIELENRVYYYLVCFFKKEPSRLYTFIPLFFRWLISRRLK